MRIKTWVELSQEVEVSIDIHDIRGALAEAFNHVTEDRPCEELPRAADVARAFNEIGTFLNAVTDEQIALLKPGQRRVIGEYLAKQVPRFTPPPHAATTDSEEHTTTTSQEAV
jgi:hypothetical protein